MKLMYLVIDFCVLRSEAGNNEKLICLYQKCDIKALHCQYFGILTDEDALILSNFPLLNCFYLQSTSTVPTIIQDLVNNCRQLKSIHFE